MAPKRTSSLCSDEEEEEEAWSCRRCTFRHEGREHRQFLVCAICGETKEATSISPSAKKKKKRLRQDLEDCDEKLLSLRRAPRGTAVSVRTKGEKKRDISDDDVRTVAPALMVRGLLPCELAERLLRDMMEDSKDWKRGTWVVHGKTHVVPRTSKKFSLLEEEERGGAPPSLREASKIVEECVRDRELKDWRATMVLCNCYDGGQESVSKHSDYLGAIGPRAVVAGLSLGIERTFRLTSKDTDLIVDLPTPHNSLIVMTAGCQETFNHEITKASLKTKHAISNQTRFSLTFRMERKDISDKCQKCHCGRLCGLKSQGGKYFFFCDPQGAVHDQMCNFRKEALWAQEDAQRLLSNEQQEKNNKINTGNIANETTYSSLQQRRTLTTRR